MAAPGSSGRLSLGAVCVGVNRVGPTAQAEARMAASAAIERSAGMVASLRDWQPSRPRRISGSGIDVKGPRGVGGPGAGGARPARPDGAVGGVRGTAQGVRL